MQNRHYYRKVDEHWFGECWRPTIGIIIKCYTEEEVRDKLEMSGEHWERIETLKEGDK